LFYFYYYVFDFLSMKNNIFMAIRLFVVAKRQFPSNKQK